MVVSPDRSRTDHQFMNEAALTIWVDEKRQVNNIIDNRIKIKVFRGNLVCCHNFLLKSDNVCFSDWYSSCPVGGCGWRSRCGSGGRSWCPCRSSDASGTGRTRWARQRGGRAFTAGNAGKDSSCSKYLGMVCVINWWPLPVCFLGDDSSGQRHCCSGSSRSEHRRSSHTVSTWTRSPTPDGQRSPASRWYKLWCPMLLIGYSCLPIVLIGFTHSTVLPLRLTYLTHEWVDR